MDIETYRKINKINYLCTECNSKENKVSLDEIIEFVKEKVKGLKKSCNTYQLTFMIVKLRISLFSKLLLENDSYQFLLTCCDEDFEYYCNVIDKLNEYIKKCEKKREFIGLDLIYLITLKLVNMQKNFNEYLRYIKTIEELAPKGIDYQVGSYVREESDIDIDEIDAMMLKLDMK